MTRQLALGLLAGAVVLAMGVAEAQAFGWRHHGSGGSYGSWGGSMGSMYGYGSYGGHVYVFQRRGWGSYGSGGGIGLGYGSGGSWGSYGSYGSYGSGGSYGGYNNSCGSCGGTYYYGGSYGSWGGSSGGVYMQPGTVVPSGAAPATGGPTPATPMTPGTPMTTPMPGPLDPTVPPVPPVPGAPGVAPPALDPLRGGAALETSGLIAVNVPADAKVFINGAATRSTGENREYISRNLQPGLDYNYEIRVEFTRDGAPATETRSVTLRAGGATQLAFGNSPTPPSAVASTEVETTLTLKVPADAKVNLAGNDVSTPGETRVYKTTRLGAGEVWKDYKITVRINRDGKEIVRTETIALAAGEERDLSFDFSDEQLAGKSAEVR